MTGRTGLWMAKGRTRHLVDVPVGRDRVRSLCGRLVVNLDPTLSWEERSARSLILHDVDWDAYTPCSWCRLRIGYSVEYYERLAAEIDVDLGRR